MKYEQEKLFIYTDEPIEIKKIENKNYVPSEIKKIRLLQKNINIIDQRVARIFCLQGKLLENYEDNYNHDPEVFRYYPTYQTLNDFELRGYFSWRTQIRKDNYQKTCLSYVYLYAYELINQIGVKDVTDGYQKLKYFIEKYSPVDNRCTFYIKKWMNDYIIYYNLDQTMFDNSNIIKYDNNILILKNIDNHNENDIINALNDLSQYKICNSPFYKKFTDDAKKLVINIYKKISVYYENHRRNDLIHDFFNYFDYRPVILFENCVFYDKKVNRTYEYIIDEIRSYKCIKGYWYTTGYSFYQSNNKKLGEILRTVDSIMREKYNYPRPLKKGNELKWVIKIINDECDEYFKNKKEIVKVEIDFSKLTKIRQDAEITKDKLIIEEEAEEIIQDELYSEKDSTEVVLNNNDNVLNDDEYHFMQCLLYNLDYKWVNDKGLMLSVLVDSINDKLFDRYCDTVLMYDNEVEVIEDYQDDLKGIIKK